MFTELVEKLLKRNKAPDWFCADKKTAVDEAAIKERIRQEISNEVAARGYNTELWTDEFIVRMTGLYYKFFDQLYLQGV